MRHAIPVHMLLADPIHASELVDIDYYLLRDYSKIVTDLVCKVTLLINISERMV